MIEVEHLAKNFRVHRRKPGFASALRSVFRREYETVRAVDGVTFAIERGERVGFLGPNGAGKTTTLKMLSGLLHPSSGTVTVNGFVPGRRQRDFLSAITLVMGQKQQLIWDLPPADTYELNRAIFDVPRQRFDDTMRELYRLLDIEELSSKPSRQLSLGERMKCELAAAMLHSPATLFLDEPTIGLDVSMQVAIREFIREYNERHEATVLLTSHYMDDVVALCPRVIVIDSGRIIYDGNLRSLVKRVHPDKRVTFSLSQPLDEEKARRLGEVVSLDAGHVVLRVKHSDVHNLVAHALSDLSATDFTVEDPPLEEIMRQLFQHGIATDAEPEPEPEPRAGTEDEAEAGAGAEDEDEAGADSETGRRNGLAGASRGQ